MKKCVWLQYIFLGDQHTQCNKWTILKKQKAKKPASFLTVSFSEIDVGLHQIISDFYLHISYVVLYSFIIVLL